MKKLILKRHNKLFQLHEAYKSYHRLYNSKTKVNNKELEKLVNSLILTKDIDKILSIEIRAERILDHYNLNNEQYRHLFNILPTSVIVNRFNGVGYRFLIHPCLTKEIYKELIKRSVQEENGLEQLKELTTQCIQAVEENIKYSHKSSKNIIMYFLDNKRLNKITPKQNKKILCILQSFKNIQTV